MKKQIREFVKVGIIGALAIAVIIFAVTWLNGRLSQDNRFNVVFNDAGGIKSGQIVQMAGVDIGRVDNVSLTPDNRALLRLAIQKKYTIPQESQFIIRTGLLGNTSTLTVIPNPEPAAVIPEGTTVEGISSAGLDETLGSSRELITELKETVRHFQTITGDPQVQRNLKATIRNTEALTRQLPALARQTQTQLAVLTAQTNELLNTLNATAQNGNRVIGSAQQVAQGAAGLTGDLRATVNENRRGLRSLVESADEAASGVAGLTAQITETIGDPALKTNLQATTGNITAATNNLVSISSRLDATASDLQRLTGDPRLSADLRETVGNIRETSESIRNLAARVEGIRIPGERRRPDPNAPPTPPRPQPVFSSTSLLEPGIILDSVYDTRVERLRFDTNYTLLRSNGQFIRAGIYDFSEKNRLNLQLGQSNAKGTAPATFGYRYGLVAGKIGGGIDLRAGPLDLRFDLYDPNRFTVNARAKAYLNSGTALFAGIDSLGSGNRATLGVQIRR